MASAPPNKELGVKLARWAFFTVLISLVPIALDYIVLVARDESVHHRLTDVLDHGELYLLSSAFLCVGLGEIVGSGPDRRVAKVVISGLSTVSLIISIGLYVAVKNVSESVGSYFSYPSIWLFLASCVVSTSSIAVAGGGDA